jgi:MFS family permease
MVNVAFPAMAAAFAQPPDAMRWVIIAYVLTYSLTSFVSGTLADRLGLSRVFRLGLALTALAHVVASSAGSFGWLVSGRVVQGLAGGMIYGTAPGLVTLAAPPAGRGRALGFLNAAIGLALALGPLAAGALIQALGWQAVFASRVPIALIMLAWAWRALPPGGAVTAYRLVRPADLARGQVVHACALSFLANAGIFAIWLLAPFYLADRRGFDALATGLTFALTPLGTTLAAPLGGRLADRAGTRVPTIVGLVLEAAGLLAMGQASERTSVLVVAASLFAAGFGLGLFQVPNMAVVMTSFPARQQGAAGGLAFMARTLGVVTGVATFAAVFASRRATAGFDAAFAAAFALAAALVGGGTVLAIVGRSRAPGVAGA